MTQTVEAIYQNGSFRLIRPNNVPLREGQNVRLTIESTEDGDDALALAGEVYEGLSEDEIDEIEQIARDRTDFFHRK